MNRTAFCTFLLLYTLSAGAQPTTRDLAPRYRRAMWMTDSIAIADAVVIGTPGKTNDAASLVVEKTLWGNVDKTIELRPPCRCEFGAHGIWILLRRATGYAIINPDERPIPPDEWKQFEPMLGRRNLNNVRERIEGDARTLQAELRVDGRSVAWILTVWGTEDGLSTGLSIDGRETLHRTFDGDGRLETILRMDPAGDGFDLELNEGRPQFWCWYAGGKREGVSREYYTYRPEQMREETRWRDGVRDGLCRTWDDEGKLTSEIRYEEGWIAPVLRYRGVTTTRPVASAYRTPRAVYYTAHAKIENLVKVGMTSAEVSQTLKVDFSEKSGITFPLYTRTRMLHIAFADGKVVSIRTGDNSVCFEPPIRKPGSSGKP